MDNIQDILSDSNTANINSENDDENIKLYNEQDDQFILTYYMKTISDDKNLVAITKQIEKMVRSSSEYKRYLGLIRLTTEFSNCSIFGQITDDDATIEFHHHPFTLFDITTSVIFKNIISKIKFSTFSITHEVLQLHYRNIIGLIPLSKTVHELVHTGQLNVPLDSIFGRYDTYISEFSPYFSNKVIEKYNFIVEQDEKSKENGYEMNALAVEPLIISNRILQ